MTTTLRRALWLAPRMGLLVGSCIAVGRTLTRRPPAAEERISRELGARRTPVGDALSLPASWITDVPRAVAVTAGTIAAVYGATRDWRKAALPGAAVALASAAHVASCLLVGRARPGVERMGTDQITSSYPSGHVGAATAQAAALAMLARDQPSPRRRLIRGICLAYPLLVGWSRLYTGQHYLSDVLAGFVNGAACARLARRATGA